MKHLKLSVCCLAVLLGAALTGCTVSSDPQEPLTLGESSSASAGESAGNNAENNGGDSKSENQNADSKQDAASEEKPADHQNEQANASDSKPSADSKSDGNGQSAADNKQDSKQDSKQDNNKNNDGSDPYAVGSEPTISIGVVHAKPGQKDVPVEVKMTNNPGYAAGGIKVFYDPALTPKVDEEGAGVSEDGPAVGKAATYCAVNPDKHIVAFGLLGAENSKEDGTVFTCFFDLPDDAKSGSVYSLKTGLDAIRTATGADVPFQLVDGEIRVD